MKENNKKVAVIGAGVSGLAASIRMRNKGYDVTVFEANSFPGGKCSSESNKGYRFDMGPSVFTMPQYVDELFLKTELCLMPTMARRSLQNN
jgi:diapolycopene oxygenase